jgi:hypothetical protein
MTPPPDQPRRRPGEPDADFEPDSEPVADPGSHRPPRKPLPPQAPPPSNQTPSVTSWTRIEPSVRDPAMRHGLSARVFDPLWMLTRQWQVSEFQGEDAGSPVMSRVRGQTTLVSRCYLGAIAPNTATAAAPYDSERMPLEVLVERQRVRPAAFDDASQLRLVVDAGLHFLRMLEQHKLTRYRQRFISCYPLPQMTPPEGADDSTRRFIATMAGRTVDARLLEEAFRPAGDAAPSLDPRLNVTAADGDKVWRVATNWLTWYANLFSESAPDTPPAWNPERMEYAVSISGRLSADPLAERTLTAAELYEGHLDWADFDVNLEVNLGTQDDRRFRSIVQTTIPAPVSFHGSPAVRFWEFEDARVEYGLLPAGPGDLAQLLMIEYASSYGNDWFLVPFDLQVGSLTAVDSLVVTDSFGVRTLLRPLGDPALPKANWSMYQQAYLRSAGSDTMGVAANLFFLAPALARNLQGAPVEDVMFMRDEMANMAWAIERSTEGPLGTAIERNAAIEAPVPEAAAVSGGVQRYVLSSRVPSNWIPLLPVQVPGPNGTMTSRLRRGEVLQPDGSRAKHHALGTLLNPGGPLSLHDEEVPREGIRVTRHYQMARWTGGVTFTWVANRKQVGRGEGSSGLRFDRLEDG